MSLNTLDYLFGPSGWLYWPGVVAAMAVALTAGLLSPLVVHRKLSFVGQGVSHAGFAGLGLVLLVTWLSGGAMHGPGLTAVVLLVTSLAAGALMARLSQHTTRGSRQAGGGDTAIGVVMVAGMAIGFVLTRLAAEPVTRLTGQRPPDLESVLFGSVVAVSWLDAWVTVVVCTLVATVTWWYRRRIVLWAVDEEGARALGVRTSHVQLLVMLLLSVVVVLAVRVAGVVLAAAVLVLPGAAAVRLSHRYAAVVITSVALSAIAVIVGGVSAFELDLPPGPMIVLAGVLVWMLACIQPRLVKQQVAS